MLLEKGVEFSTLDPPGEVADVFYRTFEKTHAGTETVVGDYHDPSARKAVADLG